MGLLLNPARLTDPVRAGVVASVDRGRFVDTLLHDEAAIVEGLAGPSDRTWTRAD